MEHLFGKDYDEVENGLRTMFEMVDVREVKTKTKESTRESMKLEKYEGDIKKACSKENIAKEDIKETVKDKSETKTGRTAREGVIQETMECKPKTEKSDRHNTSEERNAKNTAKRDDSRTKIVNKFVNEKDADRKESNKQNKTDEKSENKCSRKDHSKQDVKETIEDKPKNEKDTDRKESNKQNKTDEKSENKCTRKDHSKQDVKETIEDKPKTLKKNNEKENEKKCSTEVKLDIVKGESDNKSKNEIKINREESSKESKSKIYSIKDVGLLCIIKKGTDDKAKHIENMDHEKSEKYNKTCSKEIVTTEEVNKEKTEDKSRDEKSVVHDKYNKSNKCKEIHVEKCSDDKVIIQEDIKRSKKESKNESLNYAKLNKQNTSKESTAKQDVIKEIQENTDTNAEKTNEKKSKQNCIKQNKECNLKNSNEKDISSETTETVVIGRRSERIMKQGKKRYSDNSESSSESSLTESELETTKDDSKNQESGKTYDNEEKTDGFGKENITKTTDDERDKNYKKLDKECNKLSVSLEKTNLEQKMDPDKTDQNQNNKTEPISKELCHKKEAADTKTAEQQSDMKPVVTESRRKRKRSMLAGVTSREPKIQKLADHSTKPDTSKSDNGLETKEIHSKNNKNTHCVSIDNEQTLKNSTKQTKDNLTIKDGESGEKTKPICDTIESKDVTSNSSNKEKNDIKEIKRILSEIEQRNRVNEVKRKIKFPEREILDINNKVTSETDTITKTKPSKLKITKNEECSQTLVDKPKTKQNKESSSVSALHESLDTENSLTKTEKEPFLDGNKKKIKQSPDDDVINLCSSVDTDIESPEESFDDSLNLAKSPNKLIEINDIKQASRKNTDSSISSDSSTSEETVVLCSEQTKKSLVENKLDKLIKQYMDNFTVDDIGAKVIPIDNNPIKLTEKDAGNDKTHEIVEDAQPLNKPESKIKSPNKVQHVEQVNKKSTEINSNSSMSEQTVEQTKKSKVEAKFDNFIKQYMDNFTVDDIAAKVIPKDNNPAASAESDEGTKCDKTLESVAEAQPLNKRKPKINILKIVTITKATNSTESDIVTVSSAIENTVVIDEKIPTDSNTSSVNSSPVSDVAKLKTKRRITPMPVHEDKPLRNFENILTKSCEPETFPTAVPGMESPLQLTHEGEIPILHLEEHQLNNLPTEGNISDKNIMNLLETMNISNIDCDIPKFKSITDEAEPVVSSTVGIASDSKKTNLNIIENRIENVTPVPVVPVKVQESGTNDVSTTSDLHSLKPTNSNVQPGTTPPFQRRRRRCRLVIIDRVPA